MSIRNDRKRLIKPTHPGEMLREDFMPDFGLTASDLANALGVSYQSVNRLLHGRQSVSPVMALRLSKLFGNSADFWLNAQRATDLWNAEQKYRNDIDRIQTIHICHPMAVEH
ncbi:MAG: addiction module antidote protein, HigA family [Desulfobacteraceae bacterium IS3]|jgi:addiction module HigA family antidote|nr:MAG: addiction module antidote protein, HigA family [Desulfobacteraceae bacterium IS3]HAO20206.1 addiction module antidote protein, HigA family [Desulfobacteraceae bacterium]